MARDDLVIVQLDAVHLQGDTVTLSSKTLQALELYARQWPGRVVVSAVAKQLPASALLTRRRLADLPFDVVDRARIDVRSLRTGAGAALAMHDVHDPGEVSFEPRRLVLYGEFTLAERIRMASIGAGRAGALRATASWRWKGRALHRMVRAAGGFQANGYPAHDEYAAGSVSPLLYFDTRVTEEILAESDARAVEDGAHRAAEPFTLGFSGRHTAAKGTDHALEAVLRLLEAGADLRLVLFGSGDLTSSLQERAAPFRERIEFRGDVDFASTWVREVPRTVDLMLLPHIQGDPSGTYLESAALGVPVLGFDNTALDALVRHHGIGWTVPLGDTRALAATARTLMDRPEALAAAGEAGRTLMRDHTFETEFGRRIAHLREVAGL